MGAAVGGGWDSNLNLGVEGAPAIDAAFATAHAHAGGGAGGPKGELSLEAAWDGTWVADHPDLALQRPSATLAWRLGDGLALRLSASAGWRLAADPARVGWDLGATAALRARLQPRVAARLSGGWTRREAEDPAYAGETGKGALGLDLRPIGETLCWVEYRVEWGTETVTGPASASDARGPSRPTDAYGTTLVARAAEVVSHGGAMGASAAFGDGFRLTATLQRTWLLDGAERTARTLASAELSWTR